MARLIGVPAEYVGMVPPETWAGVARALKKGGGLYSVESLREDILDRYAQLWLIDKGGRAVGSFTTKVVEYSDGPTVLNVITAAWGELSEQEADDVIREIETLAASKSCTAVEFIGRKGWGKRLHGYKPTSVLFRKVLHGRIEGRQQV